VFPPRLSRNKAPRAAGPLADLQRGGLVGMVSGAGAHRGKSRKAANRKKEEGLGELFFFFALVLLCLAFSFFSIVSSFCT
jgi:hypothetical protein